MISSESRTISGERRRSTPNTPIEKRIALTARYQVTSGPNIEPPRVMADEHAADCRREQDDRRHLECEQVVGEDQSSDLRRTAERIADLGFVRKAPHCLPSDRDDDLDEN